MPKPLEPTLIFLCFLQEVMEYCKQSITLNKSIKFCENPKRTLEILTTSASRVRMDEEVHFNTAGEKAKIMHMRHKFAQQPARSEIRTLESF